MRILKKWSFLVALPICIGVVARAEMSSSPQGMTPSHSVHAVESELIQSGATAANGRRVDIRYSDELASHYPEIVTALPDLGRETPLEPALTLESERKSQTATLLRSGSKVAYENQIGLVTIESTGRKRFLVFRGFRGVEMKWVNDRLLYFNVNIGHVANVEALFDAETGRWLYRQSVEFP